ncbi:MAG: dockerin type I repeat-containing protein [Ruminococcus sp.]|nr:dockerin type I repeat-containing protein [Ruminococcus sp.]
MKKFISAVTSVCMTATMFAAAVPVAVNAAVDTSKGYSLRVEGEKDNAYTVSAADIAAGDVTIPCGIYIEEETEGECAGILATFGVSEEKSVNVTDIDINPMKGYTGSESPQDDYYETAQEFTTSEGTTFTTQKRPIFTGEVRRGAYTCNATNWSSEKAVQGIYGFTLPTITVNWISTKGSVWLGATSDEYPIYYFDVTLKQGAAAGDYVIDFYDFFKDGDAAMQPSNTIGSTTLNYEYTNLLQSQTGEGTLILEPLTITVEGETDVPTPVTTTTTPAPAVVTTTTTKAPDVEPGEGVIFEYLYEDGLDYIQVQPGDTEVYADLMINSNGQSIMSVDMGINITDPLTFSYISETSDAFSCGLTSNWMGNPLNSEILVDPDGNPVDAKFNGTLGKVNTAADGTKTYDPQVPATDKSFAYFAFDVPADCPEGYYYIDLAYIQLNKDAVPNAFTADEIQYTPCKIRVGDPVDDPIVTTTTTTATTPAPVVTTTTTASTPAPVTTTPIEDPTSNPGEYLLGDTNCDGKVNVADVVILNKYLAGKGDLMTDQGKINGEVTAPTTALSGVDLSYEDSTYIIQSIVHLWTLTEDGPVATEYNK